MTVSVRASTAADLEALLAFSTSAPVSWTRPERYRQESALRHHRPEWSFLAVRDRRPVGRALWWGGADAGAPSTLDDLLVAPSDEDDRVTIAAALIRVGTASFGTVPEWIVDLAVDWHDDPEAVAAVAWRTEAARQAGLARSTERVSVAWEHPTAAVAPTTPRLRFRGGDDDEFTDLFARVTVGSLDAHTRATVAELGVRGTALDDLDFYRSLPGRREDWRIAEDDDGLVVGFVLATRTAYDAAVSYIGVLPQHRGKGIVDGLLAEALRVHTAAGEPRVVATTDADNVPMRRAFERAGATVTKRRMVYER